MSIVLLILGLLLFIGLVLIHEWGHYITARRGDVDVEEFGLFFPPRIKVLKRRHGTDFTLNALPLGGFVRLKGEHDSDTQKGSYGAAPLKTKITIMTAGVVMNLLVALVMFGLLSLVGMPRLVDDQFVVKSDNRITRQTVLAGLVSKDSPAQKSGLQQRDEIKSIAQPGTQAAPLLAAKQLREVTKANAGKKVAVTVKRGGEELVLYPTLLTEKAVEASKKTNTPQGYLGVIPSEFVVQRATWSAPVVAVGTATQFTVLTVKGIGSALAGLGSIVAGTATGNHDARAAGQAKAGAQVSGPLGIYMVLQYGSSLGLQFILVIIAIVSLTLAIMNILPIPALDGGRLFVTLLFRWLKKPLTPALEDRIHGTGFFNELANSLVGVLDEWLVEQATLSKVLLEHAFYDLAGDAVRLAFGFNFISEFGGLLVADFGRDIFG